MFGKKIINQFAKNQFEKGDRKCLVFFGLKLNIEVTSVKYVLNTKNLYLALRVYTRLKLSRDPKQFQVRYFGFRVNGKQINRSTKSILIKYSVPQQKNT